MSEKFQINPMSEELRRQRRSLMSVSMILVFMKYSNLQITKFAFFGAELTPTNANAVFVFLWLIWFYFLLRYYQYYRQDGLASLRGAWLWSNNTYLSPKVKEFVKNQYEELETGSFKLDYSDLVGKNWFRKKYIAHGHAGLKGKDIDLIIPIWKFWRERLKATMRFIRNRSQFTDYLLPTLIAIGALIYCNIGSWQGTMWNLISQ